MGKQERLTPTLRKLSGFGGGEVGWGGAFTSHD